MNCFQLTVLGKSTGLSSSVILDVFTLLGETKDCSLASTTELHRIYRIHRPIMTTYRSAWRERKVQTYSSCKQEIWNGYKFSPISDLPHILYRRAHIKNAFHFLQGVKMPTYSFFFFCLISPYYVTSNYLPTYMVSIVFPSLFCQHAFVQSS